MVQKIVLKIRGDETWSKDFVREFHIEILETSSWIDSHHRLDGMVLKRKRYSILCATYQHFCFVDV
jgi:hypothetical protein